MNMNSNAIRVPHQFSLIVLIFAISQIFSTFVSLIRSFIHEIKSTQNELAFSTERTEKPSSSPKMNSFRIQIHAEFFKTSSRILISQN